MTAAGEVLFDVSGWLHSAYLFNKKNAGYTAVFGPILGLASAMCMMKMLAWCHAWVFDNRFPDPQNHEFLSSYGVGRVPGPHNALPQNPLPQLQHFSPPLASGLSTLNSPPVPDPLQQLALLKSQAAMANPALQLGNVAQTMPCLSLMGKPDTGFTDAQLLHQARLFQTQLQLSRLMLEDQGNSGLNFRPGGSSGSQVVPIN